MKQLKIQKIHYGGTRSKQKNKVNKKAAATLTAVQNMNTEKRVFSV